MERLVPRHTRRRAARALAVVFVALALGLPLLVPTAQADNLRDKQHQVQKGIKSAQADLEESSAGYVKAVTRLRTARLSLRRAERKLANTRITLRRAHVRDNRTRVALVHAQIALTSAQNELTQGKLEVKDKRTDIGRMAAQSYEFGDPKLLRMSLLLNTEDPSDLMTQLDTVDGLMTREDSALDTLKAAEARLVVVEQKVAAARQVVAGQRVVAARNLVRKRELTRRAKATAQQVLTLVSTRKSAQAAASRARRADQRQLRKLRAEDARIQAAIRARSAHQKGGYSGQASGFLFRPVPGYVTSPYGWRRHPIYGYWGLHNGTDFHAPCGTPLRAGNNGRVVELYYSSVWGNRLFLDVGKVNGKNMTLVYNHISRYRVGPGARVSRGETLAYAGTTGWSTGCHLHFTVLLDGNPVDPMHYL